MPRGYGNTLSLSEQADLHAAVIKALPRQHITPGLARMWVVNGERMTAVLREVLTINPDQWERILNTCILQRGFAHPDARLDPGILDDVLVALKLQPPRTVARKLTAIAPLFWVYLEGGPGQVLEDGNWKGWYDPRTFDWTFDGKVRVNEGFKSLAALAEPVGEQPPGKLLTFVGFGGQDSHQMRSELPENAAFSPSMLCFRLMQLLREATHGHGRGEINLVPNSVFFVHLPDGSEWVVYVSTFQSERKGRPIIIWDLSARPPRRNDLYTGPCTIFAPYDPEVD